MPTKVLAYWDNKQSRAEVEIDTNNRVTAIRKIGGEGVVNLRRPDNSRSYTVPRGQSEIAIATTQANRIQLTFDAVRNRYDGMAGEVLND